MKYASFFTGIGGFELGLGAAGHECVFSCEIEPFCDTIFHARYGHGHSAQDITKVKPKDIPDADIWVGGFPCQDLSVAGRRGGIQANRSGLVWRFLELAEVRKPRWLLLENVPGLLSSERGGDFALLVRRLEELGYVGSYRCTDAQYFGVPQRRRRIFVVGRLGDECPLEVLLEPEGGQRDTAARGEEGKIAAGELARSLGSVGGGNDFGANKGTLVRPKAGKEKAHALSFGTKPGFSDRGDGCENLVSGTPDKASAVTASAGHHGHSSPRGDGTDNLVAGTLQSCGDGQGRKTPEVDQLVPLGDKAHTVSKGTGGGLGGRDGQDDYVVQKTAPTIRQHVRPGSNMDQSVLTPRVAAPVRTNVYNNSDPTMEAQQLVPANPPNDTPPKVDQDVVCIQDVRGGGRDVVNDAGKVASKGCDRDTGMGIREDGKSYTVGAVERHGVAVPPPEPTAYHRNASCNVADQKGKAAALKAQGEHSYQFLGIPGEAAKPIASPLTSGSNPNSNMAGRRKEDDENLVVHAEDVAPPVDGTSNRTGNERTEAQRLVVFNGETTPKVSADKAMPLRAEQMRGEHSVGGSMQYVAPGGPPAAPAPPSKKSVAVGEGAEQGLLFPVEGCEPVVGNAPPVLFIDAWAVRGSGSPNQHPVKGDGKSDALDTTSPGAVAVNIEDVQPSVRQGGNSHADDHNVVAIQEDKQNGVKTDPKTGSIRANAPGHQPGGSLVAFQATGGSRDIQAGPKSPPLKVGSGLGIPSPPAILRVTNGGADPLVKQPDVTDALEGGGGKGGGATHAVAFEPRHYTRDNKTGGKPDDKAGITNAHKAGDSAPHVLAFAERTREGEKQVEVTPDEKSPALMNPGDGGRSDAVRVCTPQAFVKKGRAHTPEDGETWGEGDVAPALNQFDNTGDVRATAAVVEGAPQAEAPASMMVRRLTPTECERLQGFPDGWTCTCNVNPDCGVRRVPPWVDPSLFKLGGCGHSACGCKCSDSPRYRALGNAVAVPNIRWIGDRLAVLECREKESA
jgi:site-specific DNA-cytosine methylase